MIRVSGFTIVRTGRHSISHDSPTRAIRVASAARRGFTFTRLRVYCELPSQKQVLGGELGMRSCRPRNHLWQVARETRDRSEGDARSALGHTPRILRDSKAETGP